MSFLNPIPTDGGDGWRADSLDDLVARFEFDHPAGSGGADLDPDQA